MKRVIVLMSTFNGEKYIKEQIDSILNQEEVEVEIKIRDDGSQDSTVKIISEYCKKFQNISLYLGNNLKPAKSYLKLMSLNFDCDYYAISDQDDIWDKDKLIIAIRMIEKVEDGNPTMYFSNLRIVDTNNNYYRNSHKNLNIPDKYVALVQDTATGCTIVYNKEASKFLQLYSPEGCSMHDSWLFLICIFFGHVIYDDIPHISYRQHENNVVGTYLKNKNLHIFFKRAKRLLDPRWQPRYLNARNFYFQFKDMLSKNDTYEIKNIVNYKDSFLNRMNLFFDKKIHCSSFKNDIIYRILIIIGII